ncbi:hypothetical protein BVC80_1543g285 [Macleaya cordata]|uniref:Uncharacterized protein n=1 Tax=Macleaya cordata TaxID=56857 RepID=A0A200R269_MACCD|nr:hypothetical protein BVC80_1543g285 [Macleaya cordata]
MKKNINSTPSNVLLKMPIVDDEKSGCEGDVMTLISTQEKKTQMSVTVGQVEERESMTLDSYEDGDQERESFVIPGGPFHDGGGILGHCEEIESIMMCPNEEMESGLLGSPYVELEAGILCPNDIIMGNVMLGPPDGVLSSFSEERENIGVMGIGDYQHQEGLAALMDSSNKGTTSDDQGSTNGVLSSNIGQGNEWYSSASKNPSSFEDEWANWDFDLGSVAQDLNVWDEREEMLSWLWENDNDGGDKTAKLESEKQKALADWLLS